MAKLLIKKIVLNTISSKPYSIRPALGTSALSGPRKLHYLFVIPIEFVPFPAGNVAACPFGVSVPLLLTVKRVTVVVV